MARSEETETLHGLVRSLMRDVASLRDDIEALQVTYASNTTTLELNTKALRASLRNKTKMFILVLVTIALASTGGFVSNRIVAREIEETRRAESERNCDRINRLRNDIVDYLHEIEISTGEDLGSSSFRPVRCPENGD